MTNLVEIPLGTEAIAYLRTRLANGKGLAKHLSENLNLEVGSARTVLPDYVSASSAKKPGVGGVLRRDPRDQHHFEGRGGRVHRVELMPTLEHDLISAILTSLATHAWIFEEAFGKPSDRWIQDRQTRLLFTSEGDVYEMLTSPSSEELVAETVATANKPYPPLLAIVLPLTELAELEQAWSEDQQRAFMLVTGHVEQLAVGAYDGEGFIYWTPR